MRERTPGERFLALAASWTLMILALPVILAFADLVRQLGSSGIGIHLEHVHGPFGALLPTLSSMSHSFHRRHCPRWPW
jgi:hypothetical protein